MKKYLLIGLLILWQASWRSLVVFGVMSAVLAAVRLMGADWLQWRWVVAPLFLWGLLNLAALVLGLLWGLGSQKTFLDRLKK